MTDPKFPVVHATWTREGQIPNNPRQDFTRAATAGNQTVSIVPPTQWQAQTAEFRAVKAGGMQHD